MCAVTSMQSGEFQRTGLRTVGDTDCLEAFASSQGLCQRQDNLRTALASTQGNLRTALASMQDNIIQEVNHWALAPTQGNLRWSMCSQETIIGQVTFAVEFEDGALR